MPLRLVKHHALALTPALASPQTGVQVTGSLYLRPSHYELLHDSGYAGVWG